MRSMKHKPSERSGFLTYEEKLKRIDFGDIDGLYDVNLSKYFLDENYWSKLGETRKCFIIGRKGAGKSALYQWLHIEGRSKGCIVANLPFGDFPLARLLSLKDDDYGRPNQYQTIIRNILLCEFAKQITSLAGSTRDENWTSLARYVEYVFGNDLTDLHKKVVSITQKSESGITQPVRLSTETNRAITYDDGESKLFQINRALSERITAYLTAHDTPRIIIQIDQLDDGYNSHRDKTAYNELIVSLFKATYEINQQFNFRSIPAKVIIYLRSDIYHSLGRIDAESARWEQLLHGINWSIVNRSDWDNSRLLRLLNKRISSSIGEEDFGSIFPENRTAMEDQGATAPLFRFIIHRGFHRPRDVIQFCTKIREEIIDGKNLDHTSISAAEKKYALWFLSEIENEIAADIENTEDLYELLRSFGSRAFSMQDFSNEFSRYEQNIALDSEKTLRLLYRCGIINNISIDQREMFSIIRNERSVFNRDLLIKIHIGYQRSLHISKHSGRGMV
jgi:hypothetical protein